MNVYSRIGKENSWDTEVKIHEKNMMLESCLTKPKKMIHASENEARIYSNCYINNDTRVKTIPPSFLHTVHGTVNTHRLIIFLYMYSVSSCAIGLVITWRFSAFRITKSFLRLVLSSFPKSTFFRIFFHDEFSPLLVGTFLSNYKLILLRTN